MTQGIKRLITVLLCLGLAAGAIYFAPRLAPVLAAIVDPTQKGITTPNYTPLMDKRWKDLGPGETAELYWYYACNFDYGTCAAMWSAESRAEIGDVEALELWAKQNRMSAVANKAHREILKTWHQITEQTENAATVVLKVESLYSDRNQPELGGRLGAMELHLVRESARWVVDEWHYIPHATYDELGIISPGKGK